MQRQRPYERLGFRALHQTDGKAPAEERELRTLVPLTLEVERDRNAANPMFNFPGAKRHGWIRSTSPEGNLVLCPIGMFGCSRRLMAGHVEAARRPSFSR